MEGGGRHGRGGGEEERYYKYRGYSDFGVREGDDPAMSRVSVIFHGHRVSSRENVSPLFSFPGRCLGRKRRNTLM